MDLTKQYEDQLFFMIFFSAEFLQNLLHKLILSNYLEFSYLCGQAKRIFQQCSNTKQTFQAILQLCWDNFYEHS